MTHPAEQYGPIVLIAILMAAIWYAWRYHLTAPGMNVRRREKNAPTGTVEACAWDGSQYIMRVKYPDGKTELISRLECVAVWKA